MNPKLAEYKKLETSSMPGIYFFFEIFTEVNVEQDLSHVAHEINTCGPWQRVRILYIG